MRSTPKRGLEVLAMQTISSSQTVTVKDNPVTALPGIRHSEVLGERLREKGFMKASQVLAKFLDLDKDEEQSKVWLGSTCYANHKQQSDCYNCLVDWCEEYLCDH